MEKKKLDDIKKYVDEDLDEISSYPGGKAAVFSGIGIGFLITMATMFNVIVGLPLFLVTCLLLFLYTKGVNIPGEMVTVLCSILASLPIFLFLSLLFWGATALISSLILLFL